MGDFDLVEVGDVVTYSHKTAKVLGKNQKEKTLLLCYRDSYTGELVKLWVGVKEVETW